MFAKVTFPVMALFFYFDHKKFDYSIILANIVCAGLVANIIQLLVGATLDYPFVLPLSTLMININIFNCFIVSILPLCFIILYRHYVKTRLTSKFILSVSFTNIIITLALLTISGSRTGFALAMFFTVLTLALSFKSKKLLKNYFFSILLSLVLIVSFISIEHVSGFLIRGSMLNNTSVQSAVANAVVSTDTVLKNNKNLSESNTPNEKTKEEKFGFNFKTENIVISNKENDGFRFAMWKIAFDRLIKSPFIGTGELLFSVTSSGKAVPSQSVHNFILEILLACGMIGLCLYAIVILLPIVKTIVILIQQKNIVIPSLLMLSIFFIVSYSMFQPFFLTHSIILILWLIIAFIYQYGVQEKGN
ncbi:O-antigen ligase [Paenibacillus sp. V4I3]|uniref:O-antigen ligase family protein n=1 Tax=Paenibacillus sp. V4I3 TaxID=3042305 RepID=UPI0027D92242|nr:O-antigen ligase family protein [Paenibacillus sp. V4I3]